MQIDHVFIRVAPGGEAEAAALRAFGLTEGSGNTHPGQGTANRRFFFTNGFIELLWVADEAEATSPVTAPTRLHERLSGDDGVSPFGVCYRPDADGDGPSFATFPYRPSYLPEGMSIDIASDAPLSEPMWFFLRTASAPESWQGPRQQPLEHAVSLRRITDVLVTQPTPPSPTAQASTLPVAAGSAHLLTITFDHHSRGQTKDFRPTLPLILCT